MVRIVRRRHLARKRPHALHQCLSQQYCPVVESVAPGRTQYTFTAATVPSASFTPLIFTVTSLSGAIFAGETVIDLITGGTSLTVRSFASGPPPSPMFTRRHRIHRIRARRQRKLHRRRKRTGVAADVSLPVPSSVSAPLLKSPSSPGTPDKTPLLAKSRRGRTTSRVSAPLSQVSRSVARALYRTEGLEAPILFSALSSPAEMRLLISLAFSPEIVLPKSRPGPSASWRWLCSPVRGNAGARASCPLCAMKWRATRPRSRRRWL